MWETARFRLKPPDQAAPMVAYLLRNRTRIAPTSPTPPEGFFTIVRSPLQACYLGYSVDLDWEGKGAMSEAIPAVLDHAFGPLGLHRVMANHLPENERSARLLKRLGFETEGYARSYLFLDGAWRDHVLTARVNPRILAPGC